MIELYTGNDFVDDFIAYVQKRLKKAKNKMILHLGQTLEIDGSSVDGYYCEEEKELAISYDGDLAFSGVLAHEFNHFIQAQLKTEKWQRLNYKMGNCYELWWDWLANKIELEPDDLEEVTRRVQDVEHECECMTIKTIQEFNLPVDLEKYIQTANSYILFFQHAKRVRKWYDDGDSPSNPNVIRFMSKEKMVDGYYHLPFGLDMLF